MTKMTKSFNVITWWEKFMIIVRRLYILFYKTCFGEHIL